MSLGQELLVVPVEDNLKIRVFQGGLVGPRPLLEAKSLVAREYARIYHHIKEYLAAEDALMHEERKIHFVLESEDGTILGHQLIYGDGPSFVPTESLHRGVDIRAGSQNIFEVKRAVLPGHGHYHHLMRGMAEYFLFKFGDRDLIPFDHAIVGYTIEKVVLALLMDHGFSLVYAREQEAWIRFPTRDIVHRYGLQKL